MTLRQITDFTTTIGELLPAVGSDGVLLQASGGSQCAFMPLDDDVLDFLLERNPRFRDECAAIRVRMHGGVVHTHEAVKKLFAEAD